MKESKLKRLVDCFVNDKPFKEGNIEVQIGGKNIYTFVAYKNRELMALNITRKTILIHFDRGGLDEGFKVIAQEMLTEMKKQLYIANDDYIKYVTKISWVTICNISNPFGLQSRDWDNLGDSLQQKLKQRLLKQ